MGFGLPQRHHGGQGILDYTTIPCYYTSTPEADAPPVERGASIERGRFPLYTRDHTRAGGPPLPSPVGLCLTQRGHGGQGRPIEHGHNTGTVAVHPQAGFGSTGFGSTDSARLDALDLFETLFAER